MWDKHPLWLYPIGIPYALTTLPVKPGGAVALEPTQSGSAYWPPRKIEKFRSVPGENPGDLIMGFTFW